MSLLNRVRTLAIAAVMGISMMAVAGSSASAGDYCAPKVTYVYKTVCKYVPKTVAYDKVVKRYDHCGNPYYAVQTCYKTIKVPVKYQIKVPVYH